MPVLKSSKYAGKYVELINIMSEHDLKRDGVVVRAFGLYWGGGSRFESRSTHHWRALTKSFIASLVVWSLTKITHLAEKSKTKRQLWAVRLLCPWASHFETTASIKSTIAWPSGCKCCTIACYGGIVSERSPTKESRTAYSASILRSWGNNIFSSRDVYTVLWLGNDPSCYFLLDFLEIGIKFLINIRSKTLPFYPVYIRFFKKSLKQKLRDTNCWCWPKLRLLSF